LKDFWDDGVWVIQNSDQILYRRRRERCQDHFTYTHGGRRRNDILRLLDE
jgi:hypothetical protein